MHLCYDRYMAIVFIHLFSIITLLCIALISSLYLLALIASSIPKPFMLQTA